MILKKKSITLENLTVVYYEVGKGASLVFLHGGRVNARTFQKSILQLSKSFHVFAPDIPGYGLSDTPIGIWSFEDYAVCMEEFSSSLSLTNITLVGYSMGGGIALYLSVYSSRISQLVLIDPAGLNTVSSSKRNDLKRLLFYLCHPYFFQTFLSLLFAYTHYIFKHLSDRRHMQQIRKKCKETPFTQFQEILIPTHIIWGREDTIFPISLAYILHKSLSQSSLEVVSGNHDWLLYNSALLKITPDNL